MWSSWHRPINVVKHSDDCLHTGKCLQAVPLSYGKVARSPDANRTFGNVYISVEVAEMARPWWLLGCVTDRVPRGKRQFVSSICLRPSAHVASRPVVVIAADKRTRRQHRRFIAGSVTALARHAGGQPSTNAGQRSAERSLLVSRRRDQSGRVDYVVPHA